MSPPDFISEDFRKEFYRAHFGFYNVVPEESYVQEWDEFEQSQMGRVRFALGSNDAPEGFTDKMAWEREILIHAGRPYETLTKGCIRMDNKDIEQLAFEWIKWYRMGYPLDILEIS
ncbi:MAG: L,D-transpeptidase [Candidatus Eremiobacteraeota bacterium]|nr:L,D-transpeptidase [Candidatus Eremiobacteraeota bacterium]